MFRLCKDTKKIGNLVKKYQLYQNILENNLKYNCKFAENCKILSKEK